MHPVSRPTHQPGLPARRRLRLGVLALAAIATLPLTACASSPPPDWSANSALADIEVMDRDSNVPLPIYWHRGQRYVAGEPGRRYAVGVRNRSAARVLAVVSVDGVNAVTGETAAWDQNGYVFSPGQRWEVRGWRKSQDRIAAFEFTRLAESYAARTGRPDHVGVIGVALFREMPRTPTPAVSQSKDERSSADGTAAGRAQSPVAAAPAAPSAAGELAQPAESRTESRAESRAETRRDAQSNAQRLGTGHGASEWSQVSSTQFVRAQPRPDEFITIRYDSRQNLIALGVIAAPPRPQPQPNAFPGSLGFVPDPPLR
jgi:hypothetical protein